MRTRLLEWFDRNARELPWRTPVRDPYATLVAETMLQQTQVSRVASAYGPFLDAFPDPARLASADLECVLRGWQGLGYYRRARALHAAAGVLVVEHGGRLPSDVERLSRLPGVGRYTAVAVAAQAFGVPGIAVDANVRRVGARVLAIDGAGLSPGARDRAVEQGLAALLLGGEAADSPSLARVTEALIELGALVCTPRGPACGRCPLASACGALATGDAMAYGRPAAGPPARREDSRVLVARDGPAVALVRRPSSGRWGGLWGFPSLSDGDAPEGRDLPAVEHVITRCRLRITPVVAGPSARPEGATWVALAELAAGAGPLPVAAVDRKIARRVERATADSTEGGTP